MKIMKAICSICGKYIPEQCDGREFKVENNKFITRVLCRGRDGIFQKGGKYYYHNVRGHGEEWDVEVEEKK